MTTTAQAEHNGSAPPEAAADPAPASPPDVPQGVDFETVRQVAQLLAPMMVEQSQIDMDRAVHMVLNELQAREIRKLREQVAALEQAVAVQQPPGGFEPLADAAPDGTPPAGGPAPEKKEEQA